jgi:hypothetical protein
MRGERGICARFDSETCLRSTFLLGLIGKPTQCAEVID